MCRKVQRITQGGLGNRRRIDLVDLPNGLGEDITKILASGEQLLQRDLLHSPMLDNQRLQLSLVSAHDLANLQPLPVEVKGGHGANSSTTGNLLRYKEEMEKVR